MPKTVNLKPYEEIIGELKKIECRYNEVSITIGKLQIMFPAGSIEAEVARDIFRDELVGHRIGLLQTENKQTPLRLRIIK